MRRSLFSVLVSDESFGSCVLGNHVICLCNFNALQKERQRPLPLLRKNSTCVESVLEPGNTEWQRDLTISHVKLAQTGFDKAKNYTAALDIAERLLAQNRKRGTPLSKCLTRRAHVRLR